MFVIYRQKFEKVLHKKAPFEGEINFPLLHQVTPPPPPPPPPIYPPPIILNFSRKKILKITTNIVLKSQEELDIKARLEKKRSIKSRLII